MSRAGYPYRPARLVKSVNDWHVTFYAYDISKKELVRRRVGKQELSKLPPSAREIAARNLVNNINAMLASNAYLESEGNKLKEVNLNRLSFLEGITMAMEHKRDVEGVKKSTVDEYISTRTTVEDFYAHAQLSLDYPLRDVSSNFVRQYFEYLKKVRKSSNKTYNCRRAILHAAVEVLMRKDPRPFKHGNLFSAVPFLKTQTKKHAAYSDDQMRAFVEAMTKKGELHVLLFVQFMYYTLARPEELRHLKVGDIRLQERRILFQSQSAKTSIEQYVGINDRFAEILTASRICAFPKHYYVFSNEDAKGGHYPGQAPVGISYFYKRVKKYIAALGLRSINPNYTMYSFKHSGAISLYKATKDIKLLQQQCRHQKIDQTNTYLRDLGLFEDFNRLNSWQGPI